MRRTIAQLLLWMGLIAALFSAPLLQAQEPSEADIAEIVEFCRALTHTDLDSWLAACNRAIELDPTNPHIYIARSNIYFQRSAFELALDDVEQALVIMPDFALAYIHLGTIYLYQGNFMAAVEELDRALELDPNNLGAKIYRATAYIQLNDAIRALEDLNFVLEIEPNNWRALVGRAQAHFLMDSFQLSLDDYTALINMVEADGTSLSAILAAAARLDMRFSNLVSIYRWRGAVYTILEQNELAILDYTRVLEVVPEYATGFMLRGYSYIDAGKFDDAEADFTTALNLQGVNYLAVYRGRALSRLLAGDRATGIEDAEIYLSYILPDVQELALFEDNEPIPLVYTFANFVTPPTYEVRITQDGTYKFGAETVIGSLIPYLMLIDENGHIIDLEFSEAPSEHIAVITTDLQVGTYLLMVDFSENGLAQGTSTLEISFTSASSE